MEIMLRIFLLFLLPTICFTRGSNSAFGYSDMDKVCGTTISLNADKLPGVFFSLTSKSYTPNMNCTLTIKGWTATQRIIVVIENMDIACDGDSLFIYDGRKDASTILNKNSSQQCGQRRTYYRTATSNTVIIQFLSNSDKKVGKGFVLNVAVHFPVSTCSRAENLYRCRNNYCISNLFNCDDRNWCGDDTHKIVC